MITEKTFPIVPLVDVVASCEVKVEDLSVVTVVMNEVVTVVMSNKVVTVHHTAVITPAGIQNKQS